MSKRSYQRSFIYHQNFVKEGIVFSYSSWIVARIQLDTLQKHDEFVNGCL
jgi:hypothetical protein